MRDEFLTLFEASKALVTYIDKEDVFDRAVAGGCSGMDYYLSDPFYDFIVNTRKAISEVENRLEDSDTGNAKKIHMREAYVKLFEAVQALATHIEKERVFDKVNDMGSVGVETFQSDMFIKAIHKVNEAGEEVESGLL